MNNDAEPWSIRKLAVVLYPFAAGAVAINLFLLGLISHAMGWPSISPNWAVLLSIPLGVPAAWASGRWVRHLMDEADGRNA